MKLPRATIRSDLDRLLTWYDENKPAMKGGGVRVNGSSSTLEKFCEAKPDGSLWYRGYRIESTHPAPKK